MIDVVEIVGTLYGLYILYLGLPLMLGTPKDRVVTYVVAIMVVTFVIYLVIGYITGMAAGAVYNASFNTRSGVF